MGFFSWMTQDTDKSIASVYSTRNTFPVYMIDDKGNVYYEPEYEGYGDFGGKDYYELLAEMNDLTEGPNPTIHNDLRSKGINLAFKDNPSGQHTPGVKYPNLVEDKDGWVYDMKGPKSCGDQGYFYKDEDEEYEEEEGDVCGVCGNDMVYGESCNCQNED
jgi:hypothetical protein